MPPQGRDGRSERGGTPRRGPQPTGAGRPQRSGSPRSGGQAPSGRSGGQRAGGQPTGGQRSGGQRTDRPAQRPPRTPEGPGGRDPRTPRLREPEVPDDLPPAELDRAARAELRSLPPELAEKVSRHLLAAGVLIDDEPEAAHRHAWYARSLAPRLAIIREAAGLTAYRIGDYAAALTELRAVRRMTGDPTHLPVMADAERGLGRPDRALALARDPDVPKLDPAERVELAIVVSGARRDRGEHDAAVVALQGPALDREHIEPWTARLWYAYADALLAAGRRDDAARWFESVAAIDEDGETDAAERLADLR